jgi:uncharacterized protein (TIGR02271 family)
MAAVERTYYFSDAERARGAETTLRNAGYSDVRLEDSETSTGESFMDRVREFFGAGPSQPDHSGAALLTVGSLDDSGEAIIQQYGGRERDATPGTSYGRTGSDDEGRLRLHEERLSVNKQQVNEGEVRVGKRVVTEHQEIDVPVYREEVYVERRPVDASDDGATIGGDTQEVRIPVTHEEVQVEKRPVTTEEIVIGKRRVEEKQTVGADVRKERAQFDSDVDIDESNIRDSLHRDR